MSVGRSPCHIMLIAFQACEVEQWQDPACFFKHETLLLLLSTGGSRHRFQRGLISKTDFVTIKPQQIRII